MKYLTDSEILNWNERLSNKTINKHGNTINVYPKGNMTSSHPHILYKTKTIHHEWVDITEPSIDFTFIFSVSSNRVDEFLDILQILLKQELGTKSVYIDKNNNEVIRDIIIDESIISSKNESKHKVGDKEYRRFTYNFSGKLGSIIGYISYLEDAINFFSLVWGYKEDGTEINLLKFPIGSIVSMKDNKSSDFLVIDYKYSKWYNDYKIDYIISEITDDKGMILKYGQPFTSSENLLTWSRNNRIDNILDK